MSMRVVWKFPLLGVDVTHDMPRMAQPRAVGVDPATGELAVWCEVDPAEPTVRHRFHVRGTGHPLGLAAGRPYIGTVHRGPFVFHVYDGGETATEPQEVTGR